MRSFNELADSMFNVLALFFGFSDTRDLGKYSKEKKFRVLESFFFALGQPGIFGPNWSKIRKK